MSSLICAPCVKEQEKLLAQKKVPVLQSQLEEYKSALCQLQAQKQRLQTEVGHHDNRRFRLNYIMVFLFSFISFALFFYCQADIYRSTQKDFSKEPRVFLLEENYIPQRPVQTPSGCCN